MGTYFWIEKHDDGSIKFQLMSHKECEEEVNARVCDKKIPPYITHAFPKYLNDLKSGRVIIIRGTAIMPEPVQKVMKYEVPTI